VKKYRDHGLGGVVCNVNFRGYMTSEDNWKALLAVVQACRDIIIVVNVGKQPYEGTLSTTVSGEWLVLNSATGDIAEAETVQSGDISLALDALETRIFVAAASTR
jgi:hypothetical protein